MKEVSERYTAWILFRSQHRPDRRAIPSNRMSPLERQGEPEQEHSSDRHSDEAQDERMDELGVFLDDDE
jgi:hypothetical protein